MFQSLLISIGITGWMLRMFCVPFAGQVEVGVVLERHADQVADRVLRELGQFLGAHLRAGGTGRDRARQQQRRPTGRTLSMKDFIAEIRTIERRPGVPVRSANMFDSCVSGGTRRNARRSRRRRTAPTKTTAAAEAAASPTVVRPGEAATNDRHQRCAPATRGRPTTCRRDAFDQPLDECCCQPSPVFCRRCR